MVKNKLSFIILLFIILYPTFLIAGPDTDQWLESEKSYNIFTIFK